MRWVKVWTLSHGSIASPEPISAFDSDKAWDSMRIDKSSLWESRYNDLPIEPIAGIPREDIYGLMFRPSDHDISNQRLLYPRERKHA